MTSIPLAFVIALGVALVVTPVVRGLAPKLGALDPAGQSFRKFHLKTVPRLGGIAIVLGFYAPLVGLLLVDAGMATVFLREEAKALGLLLCGVPLVALGVFDDLFGARASQKLLVQLAIALALYALGFRIGAVSTPWGALDLGPLALPVTLLWVVGLINAMNLIDGLDGLAGGVAFFAAATTFVVAWANGNDLMMLFMAALAGAVLGFLVFNFNPASIFMGDTGSMFLGYVVAVTAVQTNTKGAATVALLTPVLALGLPIMDTALAVLRRALRGQALFQGDREHIHHRLVALGLSHRQAVLALYGVSLLFALLALGVTYLRGPQTTWVLLAAGLVVILGVRLLRRTQQDRRPLSVQREENQRIRRAQALALAALEQSASREALLEVLSAFAQQVGAHALRLWPAAGAEPLAWAAEAAPTHPPDRRRLTLPSTGGAVELDFHDGRSHRPAQLDISLEAVQSALDAAAARIEGVARPASIRTP